MLPKIALEEAMSLPSLTHKLVNYVPPGRVDSLNAELLDIHGPRIAQMDKYNVTYTVLSLNSPGIQDEPDPDAAAKLAKESNDYLAAEVAKNPTRLGFFGTLSMHDPKAAAEEATRTVRELGAKGILVNDFQEYWVDKEAKKLGVIFYDQSEWDVFWKTIEELDVPFYLHPRITTPEVQELFIKGRPWLGTSVFMFAFGVSLHILGMHTNGVFDRFPKLQVVIGHMGEFLPFQLWRIDYKLGGVQKGRGLPTKQTLREAFKKNIHITTSGFFGTPSLLFAINELGIDRVMFSIDYPYEKFDLACEWFDSITELSEEQKIQIATGNAKKLLKLE